MSTQCYSKLEEHNIEISSHPLPPPYNYQEYKSEQEHIESKNIIIKLSENNISYTDSDVYVDIPSYDNSQNNANSKVNKNKISHALLFIWYIIMVVMYWIVINNIINNDTMIQLALGQ